MTISAAKVGPGALVLIVGPSGAGKDTLIRLAGARLRNEDGIRFARRIVTRQADTDAEDHDTLDDAAFTDLVAGGRAALHWRAHGLGYALPAEIDDWIAKGGTVVANVSRRVIADAAAKYARLAVVHVTAPAPVLRARLLERSRDDGSDIEERLAPVPIEVPVGIDLHEIVNDDTPEAGGRHMAGIIAGCSGSGLAATG